MDLIIERFKQTKEYTLSRLYEGTGRKMFVLDMVEPPISGLAPTDTDKLALNPGFYRLFLKGDPVSCNLLTCFRKVYRRPRYGFVEAQSSIPVECADFSYRNRFMEAPLWVGKFRSETNTIEPDREVFKKFMFRLAIAKQHGDIINVQVK